MWEEDSTNQDRTYGLRNALRYIVAKQDDLPRALRKSELEPLIARATIYRTQLIDRVRSEMLQCKFERESFTKGFRVTYPASLLEAPMDVLRRVIAAMAQVARYGVRDNHIALYRLLGRKDDRVSEAIAARFIDPNTAGFNVLQVFFSFSRNMSPESSHYTFHMEAEAPRRSERFSAPSFLNVAASESNDGWHVGRSDDYPDIGLKFKTDKSYYVRGFLLNERAEIEKAVPPDKLKFWKNGLVRAAVFRNGQGTLPRFIAILIGHLDENGQEIIDSLPRFGIDISPDIKTETIHGIPDLSRPEAEWETLSYREASGAATEGLEMEE